jgi:predicted metal-dependent hydrolase
MKTKWGACNTEDKRIWLNLELSKKPMICLEYILVHELVHLHERNHNDRFISLMDKFMPKWRLHRDELNSLPIVHNDWGY